jgi:hypothetical protein
LMRVKIFPRLASTFALRCWILAHLLCPAMIWHPSRVIGWLKR